MCDIISFCLVNCVSLAFIFFIFIVFKLNIEKSKSKGCVSYQVFRKNFQFVKLTALRWKVWGVSYNRVHLINEKCGMSSGSQKGRYIQNGDN